MASQYPEGGNIKRLLTRLKSVFALISHTHDRLHVATGEVVARDDADGLTGLLFFDKDGNRTGGFRLDHKVSIGDGNYSKLCFLNKAGGYAATVYTEHDPPPYPVTSVNGSTGKVTVDRLIGTNSSRVEMRADTAQYSGINFKLADGSQAGGLRFNTSYNLGTLGFGRLEITNKAGGGIATVYTSQDPPPSAATASLAFVTLAAIGAIDAVTAAEHADVFAEWQPNVSCKAGEYQREGDALYRCLQDHTSQVGWEPKNSPSLWILAADPTAEWPEWSQPIGAMDAFNKGDKVSHNGEHWISEIDNNVWEPGVYGWRKANDGDSK